MRIGIVAPAAPALASDRDAVTALAAELYPQVELVWDQHAFAVAGHFAGDDATRRDSLVAMANRPDIDAVWFARGGYGAARIARDAVARFGSAAADKTFLGYSDQGNLLALLDREAIGRPVHGPMPADIRRAGGDAAVARALAWLVDGDPATLEPAVRAGEDAVAFNLMTLSMLIGTDLEPAWGGRVLMVEEVSEHLYAVDRALWHVTACLADRGLAGLRLGRVGDVPENDRPFGAGAEDIARHWCDRHGIAFLGHADIGHDAANRVVPFGGLPACR